MTIDERHLLIGDPPDLAMPGQETWTTRAGRRDDVGLRRAQLLDQFPDAVTVQAGANAIPAPASYAHVGGTAAWYGLQEVVSGRDVPVEFSLTAVMATLLACDPDGHGGDSGAVNPQAWGTASGTQAAIVIGVDLPVRRGEWAQAPVYVPGLGVLGDTGSEGPKVSRYASVFEFPPGKLNDTVKAKLYAAQPYAPLAIRLREKQRLGVAFVVNGLQAQAAAGANQHFGCYIRVGLTLGLTQSDPFDVR